MSRYQDLGQEERTAAADEYSDREYEAQDLREQLADERRDDLIDLLVATSKALA